MNCELKCSKCGWIAIVDVQNIDPEMFIDKCPECGGEIEKGYDI